MKTKDKAVIAANITKDVYGNYVIQLESLLGMVTSRCEEPQNWPLTDDQRVAFIRDLYELARQIRQYKRQCEAGGVQP